MNLLQALKRAKWEAWCDAGYWFFWTAFSMMPIWLLLLLLRLFSQPISLSVFTGQGEFALYSAGILSSAIYVVTKELSLGAILSSLHKDHPNRTVSRVGVSFPSQRPLVAFFMVLTVVSAAIYIVSTTTSFVGQHGVQLDQSFLDWLSIAVFGVSVVLCFAVTVADNSSMDRAEILAEMRNDSKAFAEEFDALGGDG